jgi:hypothetical protein
MEETLPSESKDGTPSHIPEPSQSSYNTKCGKCSRFAAKECTRAYCFQCCDDEACEKHKKLREIALFKEHILAGTTDIQLLAKEKRAKLLPPGRFREPGFVYQGDTVVIWSLREYMRNPKWREDAVRKSNRRKARRSDAITSDDQMESFRRPIGNSRKRFRQIFEELHRQSTQD